jgi:hypothetical protein
MPLGVDGLLALDLIVGHRGDLVAFDAYVADRIEPGFWVDDAATGDDYVEFATVLTHSFLLVEYRACLFNSKLRTNMAPDQVNSVKLLEIKNFWNDPVGGMSTNQGAAFRLLGAKGRNFAPT